MPMSDRLQAQCDAELTSARGELDDMIAALQVLRDHITEALDGGPIPRGTAASTAGNTLMAISGKLGRALGYSEAAHELRQDGL